MRVTEFVAVDSTGKYRATIWGNSAETKPTVNVTDGSVFIEVDTGKAFLFNESTSLWVEQ